MILLTSHEVKFYTDEPSTHAAHDSFNPRLQICTVIVIRVMSIPTCIITFFTRSCTTRRLSMTHLRCLHVFFTIAQHFSVVYSMYYIRLFSLSLLPCRNSDQQVAHIYGRLFSPLPTSVRVLPSFRDNTSAHSSLVDSRLSDCAYPRQALSAVVFLSVVALILRIYIFIISAKVQWGG